MAGRFSMLKFLLVLIGGTVFSGLILGLFGFLLAGKEGFLNMLNWGLALGFMGSLSTGFAMLVGAHYWTQHIQEFGRDEFRRVSEGEDDTPDY